MDEPIVGRVHLPPVYGAPKDSPLLDWASVEQRVTEALRYWVSTAAAPSTRRTESAPPSPVGATLAVARLGERSAPVHGPGRDKPIPTGTS